MAADLDSKASSDQGMTAVSALLFWPAAFALGGNDAQEAEYARLKGEYDAVQQAGVEKNCRFNTSTQLRVAKVTNQPTSASNVSAIDYYGQAEEEVNSKTYDRNIWAKALVEAEGDETKRKIKYIELRANQLYSQNVVLTGGSNLNKQPVSIDAIAGRYQSEITSNDSWYFKSHKHRKLVITLGQDGEKITGIDRSTKSNIAGTLEGDAIKFSFWSSLVNTGTEVDGEWKVSDDGTQLTGSWVSKSGGARGKWNLIRVD